MCIACEFCRWLNCEGFTLVAWKECPWSLTGTKCVSCADSEPTLLALLHHCWNTSTLFLLLSRDTPSPCLKVALVFCPPSLLTTSDALVHSWRKTALSADGSDRISLCLCCSCCLNCSTRTKSAASEWSLLRGALNQPVKCHTYLLYNELL